MINKNLTLRLEHPSDHAEVERLTLAAFKTFEAEGVPKREIPNEHFLVRLLRDDPAFVPELDFMALELRKGYLGQGGGVWKCCAAFDAVENEEAFQTFHQQFVLRG